MKTILFLSFTMLSACGTDAKDEANGGFTLTNEVPAILCQQNCIESIDSDGVALTYGGSRCQAMFSQVKCCEYSSEAGFFRYQKCPSE